LCARGRQVEPITCERGEYLLAHHALVPPLVATVRQAPPLQRGGGVDLNEPAVPAAVHVVLGEELRRSHRGHRDTVGRDAERSQPQLRLHPAVSLPELAFPRRQRLVVVVREDKGDEGVGPSQRDIEPDLVSGLEHGRELGVLAGIWPRVYARRTAGPVDEAHTSSFRLRCQVNAESLHRDCWRVRAYRTVCCQRDGTGTGKRMAGSQRRNAWPITSSDFTTVLGMKSSQPTSAARS